MEKIKIRTSYKKFIADTVTPVSLYLKLRDRFAHTILLESSDYHGNENSFSYVCCSPLGHFKSKGTSVEYKLPGRPVEELEAEDRAVSLQKLKEYASCFDHDMQESFDFTSQALFGYMAYDAVQSFETITFKNKPNENAIPEIFYRFYRFIIAINHFNNEMYLFTSTPDGFNEDEDVDKVIGLIKNKSFPTFHFASNKDETSNLSDEEFQDIVDHAIGHCQRGDVFQVVMSRRFQTTFEGDEFNVYRALRSINPSPYLFYFDMGDFKIFGSSPEAQITVKNGKATLYPIAGTFKRTGNDSEDKRKAEELFNDEKENAEHVMLVDLARNDLSRNGTDVKVEVFKEIQYYSHVIHLVSKVTASLNDGVHSLQLAADTFPAGTLSGAPKYKALELIDHYEPTSRSFYGGAIGLIDFDGNFNHAIMIRSILSKNNTLFYQAGAGIVFKSKPESELQEVHNKLRALRTAINNANEL